MLRGLVTSESLRELYLVVHQHAPDLLCPFRWLAVGPEVAAAALPDVSHPPSASDLTALLRLWRLESPKLLAVGMELVRGSGADAVAAKIELALDLLIENPESWEHPYTVLERPRPPLEALLEVCEARLQQSRGDSRKGILKTKAKLRRTIRIAESARRRREEMSKAEE